jgi:tRNA-Thr(GGU) m(6)t(6)A37 methyltransferase TsaA
MSFPGMSTTIASRPDRITGSEWNPRALLPMRLQRPSGAMSHTPGRTQRRDRNARTVPAAATVMTKLAIKAALVLFALAAGAGWGPTALAEAAPKAAPTYTMKPIGWIRKSGDKTFIVIDKRYQPALMGVDKLKSIWVFWWFDRNDSPEKRAILQVHPRGDAANPLRGVFATRSPYRPNLIAQSEVNVLAVRDNVIEIDDIDAFADTPVLDLKP